MAKKKINIQELVGKIEGITKNRLKDSEIVSLDQYRTLVKRKDPRTILVIDDDETMRTAMKRIFEGDGHKVLTAADGTQLSEVVDDSALDLIILDIGLPWINGFELAKLMKENEDLKEIPLIFVSGKTGDVDVKRGFDVGANDYIKKPFDVDQIRKTVNTLLKISSSD